MSNGKTPFIKLKIMDVGYVGVLWRKTHESYGWKEKGLRF